MPYEAEKMLLMVSAHFSIRSEALLEKEGDGGTSSSICWRGTGITNREIGELTKGPSYSWVSRVEEPFVEKLKKNKELHDDLKAVFRELANVKDRPLFPDPFLQWP